MTHHYNPAIRDSTGFLIYRRPLRLVVDAFHGITQDTEIAKIHQSYVDRMKMRLATAYKTAFEEARKCAGRQKEYYDEKFRHFKFEVADRALMEKKGH